MSRSEPFELEVGSQTIQGWLRTNGGDRPSPAVLVCADPSCSALDHAEFVEALVARLCDADLAVAQFVPAPEDETGRDAGRLIDELSAVFRWTLLHERLDAQRIGVFSLAVGAIFAAGLAGRTDQIRRLCLLAPATTAEALSRLGAPNGAAALLDPAATSDALVTSLEHLDPAADLAKHDRATLIIQGAADRIVSADSVHAYVSAVERAGHALEHELVAGAGHDLAETGLRDVCLDRITRFFSHA